MINKGLFSLNSNEWATPTDFYKELDAEFHFNDSRQGAPFPSMVVVF